MRSSGGVRSVEEPVSKTGKRSHARGFESLTTRSFRYTTPRCGGGSLYLWLKFAHILFAMMVAVGSCGGLAIASRARMSTSVREIRALMAAHHLVIVAQVIPGAIG